MDTKAIDLSRLLSSVLGIITAGEAGRGHVSIAASAKALITFELVGTMSEVLSAIIIIIIIII